MSISESLKKAYNDGRRVPFNGGENPTPRKDCPDVIKLRFLYLDKNMSTWQIAKEFNTNQNLVRKWMKRANIERRDYAQASELTGNLKLSKDANTKIWDNKGYQARHAWVRKNLPKPTTCELCGKENLTAHKIHWANKDHKYSQNKEDWMALCRPCHAKYDIENNGIDFRNKKIKHHLIGETA